MRSPVRVRALLSLLPSSGCFVADVHLATDGSGTIDLLYVPLERATYQSERARFTAPGVSVESTGGSSHRSGW